MKSSVQGSGNGREKKEKLMSSSFRKYLGFKINIRKSITTKPRRIIIVENFPWSQTCLITLWPRFVLSSYVTLDLDEIYFSHATKSSQKKEEYFIRRQFFLCSYASPHCWWLSFNWFMKRTKKRINWKSSGTFNNRYVRYTSFVSLVLYERLVKTWRPHHVLAKKKDVESFIRDLYVWKSSFFFLQIKLKAWASTMKKTLN